MKRKLSVVVYLIGLLSVLFTLFNKPKLDVFVAELIMLLLYAVVGYVVFIWKK